MTQEQEKEIAREKWKTKFPIQTYGNTQDQFEFYLLIVEGKDKEIEYYTNFNNESVEEITSLQSQLKEKDNQVNDLIRKCDTLNFQLHSKQSFQNKP